MKLSLVVAAGVHQGKIIPVSVTEFRIGRDPDCQLRPSSPSISKRHCAITQRGETAFIRDIGSTNGTFVNNEQVAGERELKQGDYLKAGPLEFTVKMDAAIVAAPKPAPMAVASVAKKAPSLEESDPDHLAMMMLSDGDDPTPIGGNTPTAENMIPEGSTVMEIPAVVGGDKKDEKKSKGFNADTSGAAASILSKYMRRPRT